MEANSQENHGKLISSSLPFFSSSLDLKNPLGIFKSAFNFASQAIDIFNKSDDSQLEKKIFSLLEYVKKRKRLEEELKSEEETTSLTDQKKKPKLLVPSEHNSLDMENYYSWMQTLEDVMVQVPVPCRTKKKAVTCEIKRKSLRVGIKGHLLLIDGELFGEVKLCDCIWSLEERQMITILLVKWKQWEWWKSVVEGDPEIDTWQCNPGLRSLDGLGFKAECHMRKLVFDYGQKCKGLLTSDDSPEVLKKFIAEHPYLNLRALHDNGGQV